MKLFNNFFFFTLCSFQLIFHHWKCCRTFFPLEMSAQMKCMAACFLFYRIFFSISVLFVCTTNPYLTPKASWVLEAFWFRLSLSYGCKSTNKKGWMWIHWYELWNKTTTIQPHCQHMVKSRIVPLPLYTLRLSISLRTQNPSLTWKRKGQ